MGEVYRADDLMLGQAVALKFLSAAATASDSMLTRFRNEVRTARQISHPNVCRVYDIGEAEGLTYLTMEYVDGEDLASLLRRIGKLPQDKALEIGRQLCAGLAAAHEKGVVHRDLKPAIHA
jgi:serine/threonine-protein kinase